MSSQEQQQGVGCVSEAQQVQRAQPNQKEQEEDEGQLSGQIDKTLGPGQHDLIKDVAMNPLGKRKKLLSEEIGEQNLANVGKKDGKEDNDAGSLRIRIQLDLDVEVHLSARVKGDITIGLL